MSFQFILVILLSLSLINFTNSFTPIQQIQRIPSQLWRSYDNELGSLPPLGFYDPMGLLNQADDEYFDRLRYVEIKHGRIAQLAYLGQIVTRAGYHIPGSFGDVPIESIPNGWAALSVLPTEMTLFIIALIGYLEIFVMKSVPGRGNEHVGDFRNGFIDFGWDNFTEEQKLRKRGIELNNGRAAMIGILALMVHEQLGTALPIIGEL